VFKLALKKLHCQGVLDPPASVYLEAVIPAATTKPALVAIIGGCCNCLLVLSKNKQDQQT
jgi:hypothetical protein